MSEQADKLSSLKKELAQELSKTPTDYNAILQLSQAIALCDQEHARFSVDSGLITRLGQELVSRQETAVAELVKNSYDADARVVTLSFIDADNGGGTLIVEDNGEGMSRADLINGFMRISSANKINNPFSKKFLRKRAGQKGIGRFAVQRLGTNLTIITKTDDSPQALKLEIDWNDYDSISELALVSHKISIDTETQKTGTKLIINNLRDRWSTASVKRIYRYITDVISPCIAPPEFPQKFDKDTGCIEKNADADETKDYFSVSFLKIDAGEKKLVKPDLLNATDYALAKITGNVDEKGIAHYSIYSEKFDINLTGTVSSDFSEQNEAIPEHFSQLPEMTFEAFYFILDTKHVPPNKLRALQEETKKYGGIRLYRNGFRVLPYGEPGDDWLKLDKSVRDRVLLPPHGNNNYWGYVDIRDQKNIFCETSSREGLLETESFIQLKNMLFKLIISATLQINRSRGVKLSASQRKNDDGSWEPLDIKLRNIARLVYELDEEDEDDVSIEAKKRKRKKKKALKDALKDAENAKKAFQKKYLAERNRLRILASIGLSMAQFSHEIKNSVDYITCDLDELRKNASNTEAVLRTEKNLSENIAALYSYTSFFDEAVSHSLITELEPLDIFVHIKGFRNSHLVTAQNYNIEMPEIDVHEYRLFTKPMHPSELAAILFNLFSNSVKAIKRTGEPGKIAFSCGRENENVFFEFSDTGDGISEEDAPHIFEEFFTTTAPKSYDEFSSNDMRGCGLGLKIVKDIVDSYRGSIELVSPPEGFSTCFRIEFPQATDKDYEKYDL